VQYIRVFCGINQLAIWNLVESVESFDKCLIIVL
jgi:hypothetical protein